MLERLLGKEIDFTGLDFLMFYQCYNQKGKIKSKGSDFMYDAQFETVARIGTLPMTPSQIKCQS